MAAAGRGSARDIEVRDRIVAAARRCFQRDGVRNTRIAHVAAESGMVRQTVYDFVESREQLLGLALAARIREFSAPVLEQFQPEGDVVDDLIELLGVMTEVMHHDPECAEIAGGMPLRQALQFMTGPESEAQPVVVSLLAPLHRRAADAGVLRAGLTIDEMAEWSRNALAPLALRNNLDPATVRATIRRFVLPSFIETT